ncbi:IclR family transcriptional regulator C-terminal domain-containing protein [Streptacidiphilus sp. P02-A3a]|uniref:IclR family transcriptional regulator domain-containing protein n=1 Tax=Streptacidiphilus sp. P02-A3a TaxID=2704468 RepID=UPI0015FA72A4|nr:IclR family transcriptional regulator C-terminal domain-containing protein [Streptacidiphilus sp. P02-A3a]QMU69298.1 helix-turn-helix domain-containing protein [Streptacidiphilus sp. P02-A3a]
MPPQSGVADAPPEEAVGPLERGLAVLRALGAAPRGRTRASDLVRETGLARATVDRIVSTLLQLGYLRGDGRDLSTAPRLAELGDAYLSCSGLPGLFDPTVRQLADELDESVSLAVPDRTAVRFVSQAVRRRTMSVAFRVGDLLPPERCAPGALFAVDWTPEQHQEWLTQHQQSSAKGQFPALPAVDRGAAVGPAAFAAATGRARARGWAVDDQLIEPGLVALAVPVHGPDGRVLCALSAVSHTSRHSADSLRDLALDRLRGTAAAMAATLRELPPPPEPSPVPAVTTRPAPAEPGPDFLQSLARGLAVLVALGGRRDGLTLTGAAQATGLSRATARRSLITLTHLGYAAAEGRDFRLLPRVLELGYPALSARTLPELAQDHLALLVEQVHESASLAVLDGPDVRYLARVAASRIMSVDIAVGTRFPAYATALGRVLLSALPPAERRAELERLRLEPLTRHTVGSVAALERTLDTAAADGWALVDQELAEGLRSLAVPVRDRRGRVVAAVNVSTHAGAGPAEQDRDRLLPPLRRAAAALETDLTFVDSGPGGWN